MLTIAEHMKAEWDRTESDRFENGYYAALKFVKPGDYTMKPFDPAWIADDESVVITGMNERLHGGKPADWILRYFDLPELTSPIQLMQFCCKHLDPEPGWNVHKVRPVGDKKVHIYGGSFRDFHLGLTAYTYDEWDLRQL